MIGNFQLAQAGLAKTVEEAVFWYWSAGISIIPCQGKKPNIPHWQGYQTKRATRHEIQIWLATGKFQTIGVICGEVSNNLVVMDLDGTAACDTFDARYPNLLDTYSVQSGSGVGKHLYFQSRKIPLTARVSLGTKHGFELRSNGCYVIAPPSLHPDSGKPYTVTVDKPVMVLPNMEFMRDWIHAMIRTKYRESSTVPDKPLPPAKPGTWTQRDEYMKTQYLRSALHRQIDRVTGASVGDRNNALYMSAQTLGQLIGGGELDRGNVELMLLNAAITVGLPDVEAQRTIKSGIDAGLKNPRVVPPTPPRA